MRWSSTLLCCSTCFSLVLPAAHVLLTGLRFFVLLLLLQVDALEFYPAALQQRLGELQALQQAARDSLPRPAAVVTFRCAESVGF